MRSKYVGILFLFLLLPKISYSIQCDERLALATGYDFIVMGAGAGGAVTACRLAQAGHRVLVVEAGTESYPIESAVPSFHARASEVDSIAWQYPTQHYTDLVRALLDPKFDRELGGIFYPRGKGIGGSSLVNALISVLPHEGDWARMGWDEETMARIWSDRIERNRHRPLLRMLHEIGKRLGISSFQNLAGHGFDGWLNVSQPSVSLLAETLMRDAQIRQIVLAAEKRMRGSRRSWSQYFRRALTLFDPNDRGAINARDAGLVITPMATHEDGRRSGVRDLIRETQRLVPNNLTFLTNAVVSRVLFDENLTARGVEILRGQNLLSGNGTVDATFVLRAEQGVVLSGGSFESPKTLKLSGIGARDELERMGIPVLVDAPGVGENLHDRYEVPVISRFRRPFTSLREARFRPTEEDPLFRRWQEGRGLYTTNGIVIGLIERSHPSLSHPDLYIFGVPGSFPGYYRGYSTDATQHKDIFTWLILKARTKNRGGSVRLTSRDPLARPQIHFRYFDEGTPGSDEDSNALVAGVDLVRGMNRSLGNLIAEEIHPGANISTAADVGEWARNVAWGHHATGTTARVVDRNLRVQGTQRLWVADASVFPDIPGFFIVVPTYQVAERASDLILSEIQGQ